MSSFNYELKALRSKLSRLLDVFESFSSYSVPIEEWPYWIEKFNAVASQFTSLQKEISLVLGSAVVEPVIAAGNIDHIPGVLLRSKLPPEVEEHCAVDSIPSEQWKSQIQCLNSLIEQFTEHREKYEEYLKETTPNTRQASGLPIDTVESTIRYMYSGE